MRSRIIWAGVLLGVALVALALVRLTRWPSTTEALQPAATQAPRPGEPQAAATQTTEQLVPGPSEVTAAEVEPNPNCSSALIGFLDVGASILISVAHSTGGTDVSIPAPCPGVVVEDLFALTANGIEPLTPDPDRTGATVPWACGGDDPAMSWRAQQPIGKAGDMLIAVGKKVPELLTWLPARNVDAEVQCRAPQQNFLRDRQSVYEFGDLPGRWVLESWSLEQALWANITSANTAARIDALSFVTAQGECQLQDSTLRDTDGMSIDKRQAGYRAIYGVLTLEDTSAASRAWMLFDSPGYEGGGASALPLDTQTQQLRREVAGRTIYSGC